MQEKLDHLQTDLERLVHRAKFYQEPPTLAHVESVLTQVKELANELDGIHADCVTEDDYDRIEQDKVEMGDTICDLEDKLAKAEEAVENAALGLITIPAELAGKVVRIDFSPPR